MIPSTAGIDVICIIFVCQRTRTLRERGFVLKTPKLVSDFFTIFEAAFRRSHLSNRALIPFDVCARKVGRAFFFFYFPLLPQSLQTPKGVLDRRFFAFALFALLAQIVETKRTVGC